MNKTIEELLATPSALKKRTLNATYIKSCVRNIVPEHISTNVKKDIVTKSNRLNDIGLIGFEWETYRVNALYDFSYKKLKYYENILSTQIINDLSESEPDLIDKLQCITTNIEHFPGIVDSELDEPPVKITVEAYDGVEGGYLNCFTGFLISVERKAGFMEEERKQANATILPLFLVNYLEDVFFKSVKYFLEANFSSYVGRLKFKTYDLIFMFFLFSSPAGDEKTSTVIKYKVPSNNISTIEYAINSKNVTELWKEFTKPFAQEISEDEVFEFLSVLEEKFYNSFSINLSYLEMEEIRTPLAQVETNGLMVWESDKSFYVMRHFTHLAQEMFAVN